MVFHTVEQALIYWANASLTNSCQQSSWPDMIKTRYPVNKLKTGLTFEQKLIAVGLVRQLLRTELSHNHARLLFAWYCKDDDSPSAIIKALPPAFDVIKHNKKVRSSIKKNPKLLNMMVLKILQPERYKTLIFKDFYDDKVAEKTLLKRYREVRNAILDEITIALWSAEDALITKNLLAKSGRF